MFKTIEEGLKVYKDAVKKISDKMATLQTGMEDLNREDLMLTQKEILLERHKINGMKIALGLTQDECLAIFQEQCPAILLQLGFDPP